MIRTHPLMATLAATALAAFTPAAQCAPAAMAAIIQTTGTGAAALQLQTVETPKPGARQILVKVYAAALNPVDWKRLPTTTTLPSGSVLPPIPGFDIAGVVDSVGSEVTHWKPGDAVFAWASGAFAEYAVVDADVVAAKPRRFTFEQAAGIPIAGIAGFAATDAAMVVRGQRVAIIGAAGGAGSAAVDMVRARGATVIASGHSSQREWLKKQGVEEFVAYDKENVAARMHDVDAVLNMVDGQAGPALAYVKRGGYLASIAGMPEPGQCLAAGVTCTQIRGGVPRMSRGEALHMLVALADAGQYTVRVTKRYPLAQAGAAQQFARTGNTVGKIVLVVDSRSNSR
jgi:NADPH:quinone reductase-like Zn-dependent oxidoreductase